MDSLVVILIAILTVTLVLVLNSLRDRPLSPAVRRLLWISAIAGCLALIFIIGFMALT